jgi:hypothetical protein
MGILLPPCSCRCRLTTVSQLIHDLLVMTVDSLTQAIVKVTLRPTVSLPVNLGVKPHLPDETFVTVKQLRFCRCGAASLTRGRICHLPLSKSAVHVSCIYSFTCRHSHSQLSRVQYLVDTYYVFTVLHVTLVYE